MMTWNSLFFNSPNTFLMESVILMNDLMSLFLISTLILVILSMLFNLFCNSFFVYFSENHQLEFIWTLLPFLILLFILVPSLKSLYLLDTCLFCGLSLNVVGHQWYWNYDYMMEDLNFDSYMISNSSVLRLLDVDNRMVIPNELPVRLLVTSADVIHSWTVPSLSVKMDAVPGRISQLCFLSKRSGVYMGQCSEICGANHSFMPIVLEIISVKNFLSLFLLSSLY